MQKSLNTILVKERLVEYGLNQSNVSIELAVSREAVSQWLNNKTLPKPSKLLRLGKLLNLSYSDLITKKEYFEPQIAFRKVRNTKTKDSHIKRAKEMGYALEQLVKYLPQELMIKPPELKTPLNSYEYVQNVVKLIRDKFKITDWEIKFTEVINIINDFNAILIPVLLGAKKAHENALHIYLSESETTWIYINLDTKIFDFKFWLTHELGHILSPSMTGEKAEDFVDNFAGAFLFPKEIAELKYKEIIQLRRKQERVNLIIDIARELIISPITILKEIEKYSDANNIENIDVGENFYASCTNFTNYYKLISENIFGLQKPNVENYITVSKEKFGTIFFDLLKKYNEKEGITSGYIKTVLNLPPTDVKEIFSYLTNATD